MYIQNCKDIQNGKGTHIFTVEPFSGVEIHMEMDMEWKWMEIGRNAICENVMDWFGFRGRLSTLNGTIDTKPS